nr:phosphosulfolactate synthase [Salinibacter altiplanensis]
MVLQKVHVTENPQYSDRFPEHMVCDVCIHPHPRQWGDLRDAQGGLRRLPHAAEELEQIGQQDPSQAIAQAKKFLDAGAYQIMMESEGITENVPEMRTEVPTQFIDELGLENIMFEAADPHVFPWYMQNYGPEVNLFVDHSQIVQLECLRSVIWGPHDLFGRVHTFKE